MSAYLIGNLIGRLLASFLIVLLILWLFHKFSIKSAWQSIKRPLPLLVVGIVFLLGLAASLPVTSA